jgi:hypothetical protein
MSIVITRFEAAHRDQSHVFGRDALAVSCATTAMTFILLVMILA